MKVDLVGDSKRDFIVDFNKTSKGTCFHAQVKSRSGLFKLPLKFNSSELDSEVGRLELLSY